MTLFLLLSAILNLVQGVTVLYLLRLRVQEYKEELKKPVIAEEPLGLGAKPASRWSQLGIRRR